MPNWFSILFYISEAIVSFAQAQTHTQIHVYKWCISGYNILHMAIKYIELVSPITTAHKKANLATYATHTNMYMNMLSVCACVFVCVGLCAPLDIAFFNVPRIVENLN